jgi:hypothetical protein
MVKGDAVPTYVFHSFQRGGGALAFEVCVMTSDEDAIPHASAVLGSHSTASEVEVWDGERLVYRLRRRPAPARLRMLREPDPTV